MKTKTYFYICDTWVGNYNIIGTGETPQECLNAMWKAYRRNGFDDFSRKAKWLEYHALDEESCRKTYIGEAWCD